MKFKTESGSVFTVDAGTMRWHRVSTTPESGDIRQEFGNLEGWPEIVVGKRALIFDKSVLPGMDAHAIYTSVVTEIL